MGEKYATNKYTKIFQLISGTNAELKVYISR